MVPGRLRKIIERSLALTPDQRYESAQAVVDELDAYLARRPTTFDRNPLVRTQLWARRSPQLTAMVAVSIVLGAISFGDYSTVVALRSEQRELARDIQGAESERDALESQVQSVRRELQANEDSLQEKTATLASVQHTLVEYEAVMAAKTRELQDAGVATRELQTQISSVASDLGAAEKGRDLYEGFWIRAREETQQTVDERDLARRERDSARRERDRAAAERDALKASQAIIERERDALRAERDRLLRARDADQELTRAQDTLSGIRSRLHVPPESSGVATGTVN